MIGALELRELREEFPALNQKVHGLPLAYLDNAASSLTPRSVIAALVHFYEHDRANVHRGLHTLSMRATQRYEDARSKVAQWFGVTPETCIFTSGTTHAMNILANSFAMRGHDIVVSESEHHANIASWQVHNPNQSFHVIPFDEEKGYVFNTLDVPSESLLSIQSVANGTGAMLPFEKIYEYVSPRISILDMAQSVAHGPTDFYENKFTYGTLSAHKMYGPTGIGALLCQDENALNALRPLMGGGDMIDRVSFRETSFAKGVARLEAGTPAIANAIGFGAAVDFMKELDWAKLRAHENALLTYADEQLSLVPGLHIFGRSLKRQGVLSFVLEGTHTSDVATLLDRFGIAVRTGHHCAQPLMESLGVSGTLRASFAFYNSIEEVDRLKKALVKISKMLRA